MATWHLFILLSQWCFVLPPCDGVMGHRKMQIQLKCFLACDWVNLQKENSLWAQALVGNSNFVPFPQHDPITHKHFLCNLVLRCAREYFKTTHALASFSLEPMFFDTTSILTRLCPELNNYILFFLQDYEPNQHLEFSSNSFKLAFQRMPHMLAKWSFWDGFWTTLGLFSPRRFNDYILLIISTLFSYC